jgi:hypothetical protein
MSRRVSAMTTTMMTIDLAAHDQRKNATRYAWRFFDCRDQ